MVKMVKLIFLLKRKPGISKEQFREHYEGSHVKLAHRYIGHLLMAYRRFYPVFATPSPSKAPTGSDIKPFEFEYDAITQMEVADDSAMKEMQRIFNDPGTNPVLAENEAKFLDRDATVMTICEEVDDASVLGRNQCESRHWQGPMTIGQPRIPPLGDAEYRERRAVALRHLSDEVSKNNLVRTFARAPEAVLDSFLAWSVSILSKTRLPMREREIVVVRTAHLTRATYELAQHAKMSLDAGLTADEFDRLADGVAAPGWSDADAALIRACDDLATGYCVTDAVWQALLDHFGDTAMDVVMIAAQYFQLAMMLNSFAVQVDPDLRAGLEKRRYFDRFAPRGRGNEP
jgi:4-carboxymuconolactone decarboxylase